MLESLGYKTLTAFVGAQALEIYNDNKEEIDLVITDIVMPRMRGDALIEALKRQGGKIKVIVLSGYPLDAKVNKDLGDNVVAVAHKPLQIEEIGTLIKDALKGA